MQKWINWKRLKNVKQEWPNLYSNSYYTPFNYMLHSFNQQYIFVLTYLLKYFAYAFTNTGLPECFTLHFYLFILFFHIWLSLLPKILLLDFKPRWSSRYLLLIMWSISSNLRTLIINIIIIKPIGFAFFT